MYHRHFWQEKRVDSNLYQMWLVVSENGVVALDIVLVVLNDSWFSSGDKDGGIELFRSFKRSNHNKSSKVESSYSQCIPHPSHH